MKDIKINTPFLKVQYWISWFGFVLGGGWIVVLFLANYGKTTSLNVKDKKDVLNKTWQKFVFIYGSIVGDIVVIGWIFNLIGIF